MRFFLWPDAEVCDEVYGRLLHRCGLPDTARDGGPVRHLHQRVLLCVHGRVKALRGRDLYSKERLLLGERLSGNLHDLCGWDLRGGYRCRRSGQLPGDL